MVSIYLQKKLISISIFNFNFSLKDGSGLPFWLFQRKRFPWSLLTFQLKNFLNNSLYYSTYFCFIYLKFSTLPFSVKYPSPLSLSLNLNGKGLNLFILNCSRSWQIDMTKRLGQRSVVQASKQIHKIIWIQII